MRLFSVVKFTLTGLIVFILTTCNQTPKDTKQSKVITVNDSVKTEGNKTVIFSTDIDKLGKILDFKTYKPSKVKFKYTYIDNSGGNQRVSVPGPSDSFLEAILYFDSATFGKMQDYAHNNSSDCNKEIFKFSWLDKTIAEELNSSVSDCRGHSDLFFGTSTGKAWYLDNKILFIYNFH